MMRITSGFMFCRVIPDYSGRTPIASPDTTNSTRRFSCLPDAISLQATGDALPKPFTLTEAVATRRVGSHYIFQDHRIARLMHSIVGLSGYDQGEGLEIGSHVQFAAMVTADENFAEIDCPAFRRDCL
jgi:hypothetical protein